MLVDTLASTALVPGRWPTDRRIERISEISLKVNVAKEPWVYRSISGHCTVVPSSLAGIGAFTFDFHNREKARSPLVNGSGF